jgi:ribonuclease D
LDVVFLEEIYEKFYEILDGKSRVSWCFEEMNRFVEKILSQSESSLSKNFSFKNKTSKQISQIKNIISWRENWAKKNDVPRQHFLKDDSIMQIVLERNFNLPFDQKIIEEIKKILDEEGSVLNHSRAYFSNREEIFFLMSSKEKNCYKQAKILISKIAAEENLKEQFLITSSDLKKIIHEQKVFDEKISGWRYQLFGKELEQIVLNNEA